MSASNWTKHGTYELRPQECPCHPNGLQFTGFDITADIWICRRCGAMHRLMVQTKIVGAAEGK